MTNDFLLASPAHWLAIEIESPHVGLVRYRLWGDTEIRTGRARKTAWGWIVEAK